jgi:predicted component of type VI protein secretion system
VDRIQQIGLAHPVGPHETVHLRTQIQVHLAVVAEMQRAQADRWRLMARPKGNRHERTDPIVVHSAYATKIQWS